MRKLILAPIGLTYNV